MLSHIAKASAVTQGITGSYLESPAQPTNFRLTPF